MPREAVFMTCMGKNERSRFTGPGYETMRKLAEASILALLLIATGRSIGIAQTGHRLGSEGGPAEVHRFWRFPPQRWNADFAAPRRHVQTVAFGTDQSRPAGATAARVSPQPR